MIFIKKLLHVNTPVPPLATRQLSVKAKRLKKKKK